MLNELKRVRDFMLRNKMFKNRAIPHESLMEINKGETHRVVIDNKGIPVKAFSVPSKDIPNLCWYKYGPKSGKSLTVPAFNYDRKKNTSDTELIERIKSLQSITEELTSKINGEIPKFCRMLDRILKVDPSEFLSALKKLGVSGQIVLDVSPSIYEDGLFDRISDALRKYDDKDSSEVTVDAYGEKCHSSEFDSVFPSCNVSWLGAVSLRSLDSSTPCRHAYGLPATHSFRVSRIVREEVKETLKFLTSVDNKYKTWRPVELSKTKTKAKIGLFIVCINNKLKRFRDFSTDSKGYLPGEFESAYATIAGELLEDRENNGAHIYLLEKKGAKSYCSFTFSAELSSADYIKPLKILSDSEKFIQETIHFISNLKDKEGNALSLKTSPHSIVRAMHTVISPGGKNNLIPFPVNNLYEIFYKDCSEAEISRVSKSYIAMVRPLLVAYALKKKVQYKIYQAAQVMSYLLHKNKKGEIIMDHPMYLLGRLCNLCNQLHRFYLGSHDCVFTHSIGSRAYQTALRRPMDAGKILSDRLSFLMNFQSPRPDVEYIRTALSFLSQKMMDVEVCKSLPNSPTAEDLFLLSLGFMNSNRKITNIKGGSDEKVSKES